MLNTIKYMKKAIYLTKHCYKSNDIPVGAVLVDEKADKILAIGYNQVLKYNNTLAHAEMIAISRACKKLNNYQLPHATLFTTLEPCNMCMGAIVHARIKTICFGAFQNKSQAQYLNTTNIMQYGGILQQECEILLNNFFTTLRQ